LVGYSTRLDFVNCSLQGSKLDHTLEKKDRINFQPKFFL
jgi:hypothetical protein